MRPFTDRIEVLGAAKGRQSVTITSNTTELNHRRPLRRRASVAKGQVLVDLKAQEQSADIAQAQSALQLADLTYRRWKTLGDQGIAAQGLGGPVQGGVRPGPGQPRPPPARAWATG